MRGLTQKVYRKQWYGMRDAVALLGSSNPVIKWMGEHGFIRYTDFGDPNRPDRTRNSWRFTLQDILDFAATHPDIVKVNPLDRLMPENPPEPGLPPIDATVAFAEPPPTDWGYPAEMTISPDAPVFPITTQNYYEVRGGLFSVTTTVDFVSTDEAVPG